MVEEAYAEPGTEVTLVWGEEEGLAQAERRALRAGRDPYGGAGAILRGGSPVPGDSGPPVDALQLPCQAYALGRYPQGAYLPR